MLKLLFFVTLISSSSFSQSKSDVWENIQIKNAYTNVRASVAYGDTAAGGQTAKSEWPKENNKVEFLFGLRYDTVVMFTRLFDNDLKRATNQVKVGALPINLHLLVGLTIAERYRIYGRFGLMYVFENFSALDGGLFCEAQLFNTALCGIVGIDYLSSGGFGHGTYYNEEGVGVETFLPGFGLGIHSDKHFSVDCVYFIPLEKLYGHQQIYLFNPPTWVRNDMVVNGLLTIGLQYLF